MSHIPTTTREIQNAADSAAIKDYPASRAAYQADMEKALTALKATGDDESEMWAAHTLKEALVTLAEITARYHLAVQRQARREREAQKTAQRRWQESKSRGAS